MKLIATFLLLYGFLSYASDITIKDKKIFYKDKELHPGCIRAISTQLNGDATSMIVNIEFEKPQGQFVGRGCMSANQYYQKSFMRNDYLAYVDNEKNIKDILKDPLLRFDGFGYKLAKQIDDKIFAIDIREFTAGSADFLTTIVIEVVENQFFNITPDGKAVSTTVIGLKKVGEVLKGTVDWQEKLNDALKMQKNFEKKTKNKWDLI